MQEFFSNGAFFIFIVVIIILLITMLPFPQYWGSSSSSSSKENAGGTDPRVALKKLCKYKKQPSKKAKINGLIDRVVGIVMPKRIAEFTKRMKDSGLYDSMFILDAVQGSNLKKDEIKNNGLWDPANDKRNDKPLRMNEIGCSLSHLCILQDFLDSSDNYVLIFEDDIKPANKRDLEILEATIEDIKKKNLVFDAFFLSYCAEQQDVSKFDDITKLLTISDYFFKLKGVHCANAVVISKQGARKILSLSLPITKPIDKVLYYGISDGNLVAYGMTYRIFNQDRKISSEIGGYSKESYEGFFQFDNHLYDVKYEDFMAYLKQKKERAEIENFELSPSVKSKFKTMKPRERMGIGNQLGVYCLWYLKAMNDGTDFNYNETIAKEKKFGLDFFSMFPNAIKYKKGGQKQPVPELAKLRHPFLGNKEFHSVHDIALYQNYRGILQKALALESVKSNGYDITIHLRFEDVLQGSTSYTVFPAKFYSEVLATITTSPKERILIVCAKPHNEFLDAAFTKTLAAVKESPGVKIVDVQSTGAKEDFYTLLGSNIYVMSTGTFTFFAGFLSPTVKEIHVPYFGINATDDGIPIYSADWKSTKETKIVIHKNVPAKQITKIEEL